MRYQMDNYEQPTRRQMRPTETEDVAVKVRVKVHMLGEWWKGCEDRERARTLRDTRDTTTSVQA